MKNNCDTKIKQEGLEQEILLYLLFRRGFLAWYELEALLPVSKMFHRKILETKPHLPDWEKMKIVLDSKNGFNYHAYCQEKYEVCSCSGDVGIVGSDVALSVDPRMNTGYKFLSSFVQFKQLLVFHQTCIKNLLQFYPEDLSDDVA